VRRSEEIWEYRRIVGLIRKRIDDSPCTTREIIQYMRDEYGHEVRPHELERALMRSDRIYKKSEMEVDGSPISLWASMWNRTEEE
tara:strand:+ start:81 stop:335 length:255 start_codon:yes stop_codon:yes gene_type:complete